MCWDSPQRSSGLGEGSRSLLDRTRRSQSSAPLASGWFAGLVGPGFLGLGSVKSRQASWTCGLHMDGLYGLSVEPCGTCIASIAPTELIHFLVGASRRVRWAPRAFDRGCRRPGSPASRRMVRSFTSTSRQVDGRRLLDGFGGLVELDHGGSMR